MSDDVNEDAQKLEWKDVDWDFVLTILKSRPSNTVLWRPTDDPQLSSANRNKLLLHVVFLLKSFKALDGRIEVMKGHEIPIVYRLTPSAEDLLTEARDNERWNKAKKTVLAQPVTLRTLLEWMQKEEDDDY